MTHPALHRLSSNQMLSGMRMPRPLTTTAKKVANHGCDEANWTLSRPNARLENSAHWLI